MSESAVMEGFREYIRIDRDREHMMRWEAEGVTIWQISNVQKRWLGWAGLTGQGRYELAILSQMSVRFNYRK